MEDLKYIQIRNEFSNVKISIDFNGNGPRFKIECLASGMVKYIDPLTLEFLLKIPDNIIEKFIY
jgi:hypothetical protein